MNATDFLHKLPAAVDPDAIAGMDCTVQFNISAPAFLSVRDGKCQVHSGEAPAPDVSLTLSDDNLVKLLTGQLSGLMAYMSGKLQVEGDLMLAKQIPELFDSRKLAA